MTHEDPTRPILLSDQPTMELIVRAKTGDADAVEALLQRCLPALKRWTHGRLPYAARGALDTDDIVQTVIMQWLRRLPQFQPTQVGATMAYLRRSALNRIRDEVRRITRQPPPSELPEDVPGEAPTQLELTIQSEDYDRYRAALMQLRQYDRELILARIEAGWSAAEIALNFDFASVEAARMAVLRATRQLARLLQTPRRARKPGRRIARPRGEES
jgi:RNA polymerase sigma factor (sigma-70 family)